MRIIEYFRIPHPFSPHRDVVVADPQAWLEAIAGLPHPNDKKDDTSPYVTRRIVVQRDPHRDDTLELLKTAETRLRNVFIGSLTRARYQAWFEMAKGILVGYVLWLSFNQAPWLWEPINRFVTTLFNGQIDALFRWAIVLSYPIRTFIRVVIRGSMKRAEAHEMASRVENFMKNLVGQPLRHRFSKKILEQSRKAAKTDRTKILVERFADAIAEAEVAGHDVSLLIRRTESTLRLLSQEAENGDYPVSRVAELERLRDDIIRFASVDFQLAPAQIITPFSTLKPSVTTEAASEALAIEGLVSKAVNLGRFIDETSAVRETAMRAFEEVSKHPSPKAFMRLADALEFIRNRARDAHLGDQPTVRMEKGESLANVYHTLYVSAWRAAKLSRFPMLRGFALAEFLRVASNVVGPLGSGAERSLVSRIVRTKNHGSIEFAKVATVVFLVFGVLNLYVLGPSEIAVANAINIGVRDVDTGNYAYVTTKVHVVEPSKGFSIFGRSVLWHQPGTSVIKMDLTKSYKVPVYVVTGQGPPQGLWGSLMGWLAGKNWGEEYRGLVFKIEFTPTKLFATYNYDGRGMDRFSRDVQQLIERWRSKVVSTVLEEANPLFDPNDRAESNIIFGPFLRKLGESGMLESYVSVLLGQAALQRTYAGTGFERIEEVARTVLAMIKEARLKIETDETLEPDTKEAKLVELNAMEKFIIETSRRWAKENAEELGALRLEPNKLAKMLRNPLEHILELRKHEGLWNAIQSYTIFAYLEEKLAGVLTDPSTHPELQKQLLNELVEMLNSDPTLSQLGRVTAVTVEPFAMNIIKYQTLIILPQQNL